MAALTIVFQNQLEMTNHSEQLKKLPDQAAAASVYRTFIGLARSVAERYIQDQLRPCVSATEISNSAMRSAMSHFAGRRQQSGASSEGTSEDFKRLLIAIVERKAINETRKHTAHKRDARRVAPLDESLIAGGGPRPDIKVALDEIAALAATEFMAKLGGGCGANLKFYIGILGTLNDHAAPVIREALRAHFPDETIPSLRSIQLQIQSNRGVFRSILARLADEPS